MNLNKAKKKNLLLITMLTIIASTLILSSKSYAKTDNNGLALGLEEYRNSGYTYKAIEKVMWKISAFNSMDNNATISNRNRAIYCLKGGPGFGSTDMGGNGNQRVLYTEYFNMKNPSEIESTYRSVLPKSEENYNSLVWVLENCYVPAPSQSPSQEEIDRANAYKRELITKALNYYNKKMQDIGEVEVLTSNEINKAINMLTDDEIDIVQQVAIWYFTNTDGYQKDSISIHYKELTGGEYKRIALKYGDDGDVNIYINALLNYFIDKGIENKNTVPTNTSNINFTLESSNATISNTSDRYILGPYKINKDTNKDDYTLTGNLYTADGNSTVEYTLLDANKNQTNSTLKQLVGNNFYISIPKTQNPRGLTFKVKTSVYSTNVTFWSVKNPNPLRDQPVAEVTRGRDVKELVASTSEFDLALRKFITKINNVEVQNSREPIISTETKSNLKEGSVQTVTKTHRKDPLIVNKDDTVLYTIRVYNEGKVDGYASEVTDYLPNGLELKENSEINKKYGWKNPSGDKKTIVTDYLSKSKETQNENILRAFDGTNVNYKDLEIECTVKASYSGNDMSLKNVAEITKHSDANGDENIVDRDSIPNNLTNEQKNNYNPGTSEQGWGYEDDDDYEELLLPKQEFDLALRKFITNINGKDLKNTDGTYTREPNIDLTPLKDNSNQTTTANYKHRKDPVGVAVGDIVIYTIRVYNEGKVDGYASEVTDYLPPQLEFLKDDEEINQKYLWKIAENDPTLRKITTYYLSKQMDEDNLLKAFDGTTLDSKELKIKCRVKSVENLNEIITNIAEITAFTDADGKTIRDIDSTEKNVALPSDSNLPDYKGNENNKSVLSDSSYFYKGQEDDDDFEKLILQEFDLALRKFITGVNDTKITNREPVFTNIKDENGNYKYEHTKVPVEVETTDIVEYTMRIYNEGDISGYAKLVKDDIPEGLEFLPNDDLNKEYRWKMLDENENETTDVSKAKYILTDYLSKEQESNQRSNLIKAFDKGEMKSPDYKDIKANFKVVAPNTHPGVITNTAEIADDSDENGNPVKDRDSEPNNNNKKEDDIDIENIILKYFDLALRKFITGVNEEKVTSRYPVFSIDENGKYVYNHTKEPVEVVNGDIVIYTIRVYNEGTMAGYAQEVKDDIPEGLEFLPYNELNKKYRWEMLDEEGNKTTDKTKAVSIVTDYLSKENENANNSNLLLQFSPETMKEPHYKDVEVAFKVTEPNTSDRIIINKAQISEDADKDGKPVIDIDSTPDKWIEGEDDQDIEKIKVKYFDLALRKWVTQAIVIENGKEKITETGHKAEDDPEDVVKVELVESKLNKVVVKFRYKIRITNEGEIAGYATEISDYIPKGLKFVAADNPKWKEVEGKIVTDQLKDTLLQPGDSAEVEVLLTWINAKDNLNLKINIAEISKDKNDSNTPDIDSTPNNQKPGEDDIDDAPVILSVKTGTNLKIEYIITTLGALVLLSAGTITIKKYVLI